MLDNPNQYKIGDGVHAWNDLPLRGFDGTLVHELGNSETAAMSQQGVTTEIEKLHELLITKGTIVDVTEYIVEGKFWDDGIPADNEYYKYANKVPVSAGQFVYVEGLSGNHGLIYYYSSSDVLLYRSALSSGKYSCLYIYNDGYLMINSQLESDIIVYAIQQNSTLWQIGRILNSTYRGIMQCGFLLNAEPELDTVNKTFTIKAGTLCVGRGIANTIIDNDITITQNPTNGSHFIILNPKTQTMRLVNIGSTSLNLTTDEYLVAIVRWNECVYEGYFRRYKLNGKTIDFKPQNNLYEDLCVKRASEFEDGYYGGLREAQVGDIKSNGLVLQPNSEEYNQTYKSYKFSAVAGSTISIYGLGGSGDSRLYCVIDKLTKQIIHLAEKAENTRTIPKVINLDTDCDVYITNSNTNGRIEYTIKLIDLYAAAAFPYYALLYNKTPKLDTTERTFTIPKGSHILGPNGNVILPSGDDDSDIVYTQEEAGTGSGSHILVLNTRTFEKRAIASGGKVILSDNEVAIGYIRWGERVYDGNFPQYYLNNTLVVLKPNRNYGGELDYLTTKSGSALASKSYYNLSAYSVGNKVESLNLISHENTFYNFNFIAYKGDRVIIKGMGSTQGSRLYMFVNNKTRIVTAIADAGVNAIITPLEFVMSEDTEIYGTSTSSNCYVKLYRDVFAKREENTTISEFLAPKMFNPPINLQKEQLKVLDIGNSYTDDSTHYLSQIVSASGVDVSDMCLYKAIRGGASYKNWFDIYHDQDTAGYSVSKVVGALEADTSGTAAIGNGEKFRNTLKNNEWDLIIIHQVSTYAPYYDRWNEDNNAGYLDKFIRLLRKCQPKATIGFLLVHSYWSGYGGNTEKSSLERWKLIAQSAMKLRAAYGIDFIIPYGTAIQNLRASSLNNDYDLTADGTHCANGLADYTAACAYYQSLFAPRYGVGILGNTARITVEQNETYPSSDISVTDENAPIAQKAALAACYNWYECINPETLEDLDM